MSDKFDSWAILEMFGHTRTAGRVTEEERFGGKIGRCDVPDTEGGFTTFYFGNASIFRMTPCTEEAARIVALRNQPEPVHLYELPKQLSRPAMATYDDQDVGHASSDNDDEDDDDVTDDLGF